MILFQLYKINDKQESFQYHKATKNLMAFRSLMVQYYAHDNSVIYDSFMHMYNLLLDECYIHYNIDVESLLFTINTKDPWGNNYQIDINEAKNNVILYSLGDDGIISDDDIKIKTDIDLAIVEILDKPLPKLLQDEPFFEIDTGVDDSEEELEEFLSNNAISVDLNKSFSGLNGFKIENKQNKVNVYFNDTRQLIESEASNILFTYYNLSNNANYFVFCGRNSTLPKVGMLTLYEIDTNEIIFEKDISDTTSLISCCFSSDDKKIFASGKNGIYCVDIETGMELNRLGNAFYQHLVLSGDGRFLAAGTNASGELHIYDLNDNSLTRTFRTGKPSVFPLAFSDDSKFIASKNTKMANTKVKIWKIEN